MASTVSDEWDMTRKITTQLILDQFMPYILNRAGHRTGEMFSQDLIEFGLVLSDWRIMIALWQNENRRLNELADITFSDLSTLSRQVRAMEKSRLIARKRSRTDGRALNLVLTPKGRTITAKLIPIARMYENVATLGISDKETDIVRRCVTKMYKNLEAFGETRRNESTTKRDARQISAA